MSVEIYSVKWNDDLDYDYLVQGERRAVSGLGSITI